MTITPRTPFTDQLAERLARIALACLRREYPNQIAHAMSGDADVGPPRVLHPAFFGCYDWHSAVHGHWCLARLLRASGRDAAWRAQAVGTLRESLAAANLLVEHAYLAAESRATFERPYGLAWVLALEAELRKLDGDFGSGPAMRRLAGLCAERLAGWAAALTHPVRTGVHSQSAFAMALALDWARDGGDTAYCSHIAMHARRLYGNDRAWPLAFEPSGEDFLSPSLAEADLMRRVMGADEFASWLAAFLPELAGPELRNVLAPVRPLDARDARLAHLDGLSLSRAWMLEGIARALPSDDTLAATLLGLAADHLRAGLERVEADDYARAHWLATFATYALTGAPSA